MVVSFTVTILIFGLIILLVCGYNKYVYSDNCAVIDDEAPTVFRHHDSEMTITQNGRKLSAPSSMAHQDAAMFGDSVLVDDNKQYVAITVPGYGEGKLSNGSGCVLIYKYDTGKLITRIFPPKNSNSKKFGKAIQWDGDDEDLQLKIFDIDNNVFLVSV